MTDHRPLLSGILRASGLSRAQAAALLYQSPHTIDAWLKPATSKSANPTPLWACELLALKTGQPMPKTKETHHALRKK